MPIQPGTMLYDTHGAPLNAHGAGFLRHAGLYYLYGEARPPGPSSHNALIGVSCYSSPDFVRWTYEGIVMPVVHNDPNHPLSAGCKVERPKVLYNQSSGKFVMWWHHDLKGWGHAGAYAGVAVADLPTGPFEFVEILHPAGCMFRDCTLFQDNDASGWAIFATDDNANIAICKLTDDYLRATKICFRVFHGRYMEAPCVFLRDGVYYLIASDCSGWHPNEARSAWAPTLTGPWKEMGNPCLGDDAEITFGAQGTFVAQLDDTNFVFLADRWLPNDIANSTYVWLPLEFRKTVPFDPPRPLIRWRESWSPAQATRPRNDTSFPATSCV